MIKEVSEENKKKIRKIDEVKTGKFTINKIDDNNLQSLNNKKEDIINKKKICPIENHKIDLSNKLNKRIKMKLIML